LTEIHHEKEVDGSIPFLDMKIICEERKRNMVYKTNRYWIDYELALLNYKRSVVNSFVHRIYRACCTWINFHRSMEKARRLLRNNQYPPMLYEQIIKKTLETIVRAND